MSKSYGRDRERASVLRFLSAPGGLLAIDGPPCSGKTLLLGEAVDAARDRGYAVALVPGSRVAGSAAVAEVLGAPAGARPLLAVDRAHEDPAALLALLPLLRARRVTTLVALGGTRADTGVRRALGPHDEVVDLWPLDEGAVRRMLDDLLGVPPAADLDALAASAAGHPGLVAALVAGLREEGRLDLRDGTARVRGARLPRRVRDHVRGQAGPLSAEAARVLRVAAVIGGSAPLPEVAAALGDTPAALRPAVAELAASGLVACAGERLAFGSELVRRAVVESVPRFASRALRDDVAVLRAEGPPGQDRGAAAVRAVRALAAAGRLRSAVALARAGLDRGLPAGHAAELRLALTGVLLAVGRPAEAVAEAQQTTFAPDVPRPLRHLAAAGRLLALHRSTGDRAGAHAMSVLTARDRAASDADVVMAAAVRSCLEWSAGRLAEALYWGRESTRWELDRPTAWWQSHAAVAFALKLSALGEFDRAGRLVSGDGPEADAALPAGAPAARAIARARVLAQAGDLVRAHAAAAAGLGLARDRGLRVLVPPASTVLAVVALLRGDVRGAARHVRRCGDGDPVADLGQRDWVELLLAHAQDGPARASDLARERLADPARARRVLVGEPGAAPWLVRLALAEGDGPLARAAAGAARALAEGNPGYAAVSAAASHARALVERDAGALLAVTGLHRHPWARAGAHEDLALLLAEEGRAEDADAHLARALLIFERMGADGEAARLRARTPPTGPAQDTPAHDGAAAPDAAPAGATAHDGTPHDGTGHGGTPHDVAPAGAIPVGRDEQPLPTPERDTART